VYAGRGGEVERRGWRGEEGEAGKGKKGREVER